MLTIAFMCLSRIENINQLANIPPGEWGALLGIDRIPEKDTLREKLAYRELAAIFVQCHIRS